MTGESYFVYIEVVPLLLVLLVAAPLVAAAAATMPRLRPWSMSLVQAVAGGTVVATAALLSGRVLDGPVTVGADRAWLRFDDLSALLAGVVTLLATMVLTYARRNLAEDGRAWRLAAAAGLLLGGTLLLATAGRLSVLVGGWLLASVAVVALVGYRGDPAGRQAARRASTSLAVGDAALLVATGITLALVGDVDLAAVGPAVTELSARDLALGPLLLPAAEVVTALMMIAAAGRAAQLPVFGWLTGTLAAPTPVSALLHAGAVNAGGFLLVRLGPAVEAAPVAAWTLAAVAVATIVTAAGAALVRPDVKGALAASTSAQMGFMLLAVVVGAPAAALTHLVGHAFYKASRFLGAGEAVRLAVGDRRHPVAATPPAPTMRAALALGLPAVVLSALWVGLGLDGLPSGEAWLVAAAAYAAGAQATWALCGAWDRSLALVAGVATGVLLVVGGAYLALVTGLGVLLDPLLTHAAPPVDARVALGALAGAVVLAALAGRRTALAAPLVGFLGGLGRSRVPRPATVRAPRPLPATRPVPALEGSW